MLVDCFYFSYVYINVLHDLLRGNSIVYFETFLYISKNLKLKLL